MALLTTIVLAPDTPDTAVGDATVGTIAVIKLLAGKLVEITNCPTATKLLGAIVMLALLLVVAIDAEKSKSCVVLVVLALIG